MKNFDKTKKLAINTLKIEAEAIHKLTELITPDFGKCVKLIYESKGRVIITGIGKSAIVAQKIVATLNSTGTPSVFMHAADAIHGDLGTIQKNDIIICISKSGNTPEIKMLVPLLKKSKNKLIALVGNIKSYLAIESDFVLDCTVEKEACPNNLAPTSSTTAQMALGDALAVCLLDYRGFSKEDFAQFHPGGALGKKLYLTVGDISTQNLQPKVDINDSIKKVILEISKNRLGATGVLKAGRLVGIITDGDLRRMLEKASNFSKLRASDIMSKNPHKIEIDELAINALEEMNEKNISQLIVTQRSKYKGILHIHDLMREGII